MHILWWQWVSIGILLLLLEMMTPGGFYLFFIGIAAVLAGAAAAFIPSALIQIIIFIVLMTINISFFRKKLVERVKKSTPRSDRHEFIGEEGSAKETIAAGGEGMVEVRGTTWQARNAGETELPANASCTVISRDGLRLVVKPKS